MGYYAINEVNTYLTTIEPDSNHAHLAGVTEEALRDGRGGRHYVCLVLCLGK